MVHLSKNPPIWAGFRNQSLTGVRVAQCYFCQVRFLCRFALRRFRRLCFDIFRRRFFLRLPMVKFSFKSANLRFSSDAVKHNLRSGRHRHLSGLLGKNHFGAH